MKRSLLTALPLIAALLAGCSKPAAPLNAWHADNGDGTFTNPLLWGDWPDPDVIRVGDTFYMVSTSMHYVPGVPILASKDLVNWEMAGYALERYDEDPRYDLKGGSLYLNGAWASTIRHHNGKFYVGFCTPYGRGTKTGHFSLCEADDIRGPWRRTIFPEYLYDPGLFIDDDGKAYHLYASEDNGTLQIAELDDTYTAHTGRYVRAFEGRFMEAPALFKKDGKYWFIGSGCSGWAPNAARSAVEAPTKTVPSLDCTGGGKALSRATAGSFTIPAKRGERSAKPCAAPISGTAATATKSPRRLTRPRICGTARPRRPRVCATARQRHIRPRRPPRGCPR